MANKWFYSCETAEGIKGGYGPFDTFEEADAARDVCATDNPDWTVSEAFQTDEGYEFPTPQARITRSNGSEYMQYSDGSTSELT